MAISISRPSTTAAPFAAARQLSHTCRLQNDKSNDKSSSQSFLESIYSPMTAKPPPPSMEDLTHSAVFQALSKSSVDTSILRHDGSKPVKKTEEDYEPFHLHVYSHKHNTHISCTKPNREAIISLSCGNIGFKNSRRGTFDSAYSLAKYVLERLVHMGWPMKIKRLELVFRGFGQGREAAMKVLMSPEGKVLRDKIVRVSDSTRVKYAGTRSKKPRRL